LIDHFLFLSGYFHHLGFLIRFDSIRFDSEVGVVSRVFVKRAGTCIVVNNLLSFISRNDRDIRTSIWVRGDNAVVAVAVAVVDRRHGRIVGLCIVVCVTVVPVATPDIVVVVAAAAVWWLSRKIDFTDDTILGLLVVLATGVLAVDVVVVVVVVVVVWWRISVVVVVVVVVWWRINVGVGPDFDVSGTLTIHRTGLGEILEVRGVVGHDDDALIKHNEFVLTGRTAGSCGADRILHLGAGCSVDRDVKVFHCRRRNGNRVSRCSHNLLLRRRGWRVAEGRSPRMQRRCVRLHFSSVGLFETFVVARLLADATACLLQKCLGTDARNDSIKNVVGDVVGCSLGTPRQRRKQQQVEQHKAKSWDRSAAGGGCRETRHGRWHGRSLIHRCLFALISFVCV